MTQVPNLLIFSLVLITITSSKVSFLPNFLSLIVHQNIRSPKYHDKIPSTQNPTSSMDFHYLDACTAILRGVNDVDSSDIDYWYYFAEWENTNLDGTVKYTPRMTPITLFLVS